MTTERQAQKKRSRAKNDITTMQLSNELKKRLKRIQIFNQFDKQDEALDEVLSYFEDNHPDILLVGLNDD